MPNTRIQYVYENGGVRCHNRSGLTFFLQGDPRTPITPPEETQPRFPQPTPATRIQLEFLKG
jgi:hypothetical protein